MGWIRKWDEENGGDGGQELQYREVGKWTLSMWLNWTRWRFGMDVEREFGDGRWPNRLHLSLCVGPLHFAAMREWPE